MAEFRLRCLHYARGTCAAGADVEARRDPDGRLPCVAVDGIHGDLSCDLREDPADPEPIPPGVLTRALERVLAGACPECGGKVDRTVETDTGAVIALPCRHVVHTPTRRSA